jgi:hypothetical protein
MPLKVLFGSLFILTICFLSSCSSAKKLPKPTQESVPPLASEPVPVDSTLTDIFLENLLKQYPQYFDSVLSHKKDWNVQFIYTMVDRGANGIPVLKNYYYNLNPARYFYPASTVKLPICILALQRLNELK